MQLYSQEFISSIIAHCWKGTDAVDTRDTNTDWQIIAKEQPYWGVLSVDQFRGRDISGDNRAQFFASGVDYVNRLLGLVHKHFGPVNGRALDFGCGVGRLSIALASKFKEVVGVDVSEEMLNLCRNNARQSGVRNIELVLSDDALSRVTGQFDLVNTIIVLQHIPHERGIRIFQRLIDLTKVGGICSIQVTYARERHMLAHELGSALYYRRTQNALLDLRPSDTAHPPGTITMYDYDLNEIFVRLSEKAGSPVICIPTNDGGHLGVHFVFCRGR